MNDYILGAAIGGISAFAFSVPAIVLETISRFRLPNALYLDVKTMWGKKLEKHEVFLAALLIHLVLGALFGLVYVAFVKNGWLVVTHSPYTIVSLLVFAVGSLLVTGLTIFPALGLGLFGRKEGTRVWMETLASFLIVGLGMWALVKYYQPFFFVS